jgi:pyruvate dehydrogenase phosphatase
MYLRRFSVAVVSGLVGYGAWYAYKGNGTDLNGQIYAGAAQQARGLSTSAIDSLQNLQAAATIERRAVIVGADTLYTGAIKGEGPISKDTDGSGRKVLEMLTPEQATQKLRRNEESYLVGRGNGVVRYDVVQIPSNDPIEDDHSEKIIELPPALAAATATKNPTSDWMFWGVFDGHAYVHHSVWLGNH